ncbi:Hypothetical protein FKW44_000728, partial [Caligus rogercresseyi]
TKIHLIIKMKRGRDKSEFEEDLLGGALFKDCRPTSVIFLTDARENTYKDHY